MEHKAKLTISRPSFADDRKKISITVRDVDARISFLKIEVDCDKFAECLTGLSGIDCEMDVFDLQNVGKKIETTQLVFEMGELGYESRKEKAAELAWENVPEGWIPSVYFGSQNSFFEKDGKKFARTTASRWVEK